MEERFESGCAAQWLLALVRQAVSNPVGGKHFVDGFFATLVPDLFNQRRIRSLFSCSMLYSSLIEPYEKFTRTKRRLPTLMTLTFRLPDIHSVGDGLLFAVDGNSTLLNESSRLGFGLRHPNMTSRFDRSQPCG